MKAFDTTQSLESWYQQQVSSKAVFVKQLMDKTILDVCHQYGVVILTNPTNPYAFYHLHEGATTKTADISLKTERSGLMGGYILSEPTPLSQPVRFYCEQGHTYYVKNNHNQPELNLLETDTPITEQVHVLTNAQKRIITSDLDILLILAPEHCDRSVMPESYQLGSLLKYEWEIIQDINTQFENKLKQAIDKPLSSYGPLIQHGPFARFHKTKASFIHFSLSVYDFNHGYQEIEPADNQYQQLADVLRACAAKNLLLELPKSWRTICEL